MAVGDMRYTFTDKQGQEHQVDIPAEVIRKGRRDGLSNRDTILLHLANNGYMVDAPAATKKEKKKATRTRKPDEQKRAIMKAVSLALEEFGVVENVNPERQVRVQIIGDVFELTMVKKRKPKN